MGKMQRDKGARFERKVAKMLADFFPDAKRGIGQTRAATEVPDVQGTPYWVECKVGKRPPLWRALEQAEAATSGRECLVIAKRDRDDEVVFMRYETFAQLLRAMQERLEIIHDLMHNAETEEVP